MINANTYYRFIHCILAVCHCFVSLSNMDFPFLSSFAMEIFRFTFNSIFHGIHHRHIALYFQMKFSPPHFLMHTLLSRLKNVMLNFEVNAGHIIPWFSPIVASNVVNVNFIYSWINFVTSITANAHYNTSHRCSHFLASNDVLYFYRYSIWWCKNI